MEIYYCMYSKKTFVINLGKMVTLKELKVESASKYNNLTVT